ncbi:MAG: hypothetical protein ABSG99_09330 [Sedimentisphaerales bacterium]
MNLKKIFSVVIKAILVVCIIVILWQLVMVRFTLSSIESDMYSIKQGLFASPIEQMSKPAKKLMRNDIFSRLVPDEPESKTKIRFVPKPSIESRVSSIKNDIFWMQQQISLIEDNVSSMKLIESEVSSIVLSIYSIENDVSKIKDDMSSLKSDISSTKSKTLLRSVE